MVIYDAKAKPLERATKKKEEYRYLRFKPFELVVYMTVQMKFKLITSLSTGRRACLLGWIRAMVAFDHQLSNFVAKSLASNDK